MTENVLKDIVIALDSWTEKIIDVESRIKKTQDIRKSVLDSLNRQVLDGLISEQDSIELEYICDLWGGERGSRVSGLCIENGPFSGL